jgi:hypothetical protein
MMESAPPASETLYSGDVPMLLKHHDREDRHGTLTVEMSYGVTQPRNQRVLHVQLTDEVRVLRPRVLAPANMVGPAPPCCPPAQSAASASQLDTPGPRKALEPAAA